MKRRALNLAQVRVWVERCGNTILLTAVIGSAVVPTIIAQIWSKPHFEPLEDDA